jgi:hypothetical protein
MLSLLLRYSVEIYSERTYRHSQYQQDRHHLNLAAVLDYRDRLFDRLITRLNPSLKQKEIHVDYFLAKFMTRHAHVPSYEIQFLIIRNNNSMLIEPHTRDSLLPFLFTFNQRLTRVFNVRVSITIQDAQVGPLHLHVGQYSFAYAPGSLILAKLDIETMSRRPSIRYGL